jgi:hypothetical protein
MHGLVDGGLDQSGGPSGRGAAEADVAHAGVEEQGHVLVAAAHARVLAAVAFALGSMFL